MSEKIQEDRDPMYSATPYDDAFRTMEGECDDLLIPLVNYFFNESYDSDAVVTRMRNEHFIENPYGSEQKRITDSYFSITSKETIKKYHRAAALEGGKICSRWSKDNHNYSGGRAFLSCSDCNLRSREIIPRLWYKSLVAMAANP